MKTNIKVRFNSLRPIRLAPTLLILGLGSPALADLVPGRTQLPAGYGMPNWQPPTTGPISSPVTGAPATPPPTAGAAPASVQAPTAPPPETGRSGQKPTYGCDPKHTAFPREACAATCSPPATTDFRIIGDSHTTQEFGDHLEQLLGGPSHVQRYAVAGSAAASWEHNPMTPANDPTQSSDPANNPWKNYCIRYACPPNINCTYKLPPASFPGAKELLGPPPAKTVVIALGTNDFTGVCNNIRHGMNREQAIRAYRASLKKMADMAPEGHCVWIGPPKMITGDFFDSCKALDPAGHESATMNELIDTLKESVSGHCKFIDSREYTMNGGGPASTASCRSGQQPLTPNIGGSHFKGPPADRWADCVAADVKAFLTLSPHAEAPGTPAEARNDN